MTVVRDHAVSAQEQEVGVMERHRKHPTRGGVCMSTSTLLMIVLLIVLIGALPTWPHSRTWGYYPSGGLGLVLLIVIVLLLMGRI